MHRSLLLVFTSLLVTLTGAAQTIKVAVAANAQFVMEEIRKAYQTRSGSTVELIVSSSGKLTAQIRSGAPYSVFLSADTKYPEALYAEGLTQGAPQVYAYGSLVLWSLSKPSAVQEMRQLTLPVIRNIALANPKLAPYGEAAIQALTYYRLYKQVKPKIVYGESISQVNQYIVSGAAEVGFTAKSVVLHPSMQHKGTWTEIDRKAYQPIAQAVVLLQKGTTAEAQQFYQFLFSKQAKAIFKKYGYLTE